MTVEFDCEGCGWHVIDIVGEEVPAHGFCLTCAFLCEEVPDPVEMMLVRRLLEPRDPK